MGWMGCRLDTVARIRSGVAVTPSSGPIPVEALRTLRITQNELSHNFECIKREHKTPPFNKPLHATVY